jgi:hypothetical protein
MPQGAHAAQAKRTRGLWVLHVVSYERYPWVLQLLLVGLAGGNRGCGGEGPSSWHAELRGNSRHGHCSGGGGCEGERAERLKERGHRRAEGSMDGCHGGGGCRGCELQMD